eukprot:5606235-Amphidinium_carterae.1
MRPPVNAASKAVSWEDVPSPEGTGSCNPNGAGRDDVFSQNPTRYQIPDGNEDTIASQLKYGFVTQAGDDAMAAILILC